MILTGHYDLLSIAVAVAGIVILGFVIFLSDRQSATNRVFLSFSLITALWGIVNYFTYSSSDAKSVLFFIRLVIFCATIQAYYFFKLMYVFPNREMLMDKHIQNILKLVVIFVAFFTLTPFVFSDVIKNTSDFTYHSKAEPGILVFVVTAISLVFSGLYFLYRKYKEAKTTNEHQQFKILFIGTLLMFSLIITFNLILPNAFDDTSYIPFGALFILPFIISTSYAIQKFKLFNLKVASVALVAFVLTIFSFFNILYAVEISQIILNTSFFFAILVGSIILIQSILVEIKQRERLEILTEALEEANDKLKDLDKLKTEFLSLASHQLRSPLTAIKGYTSMLLEGSFGEVKDPNQKEAIDRVFQSSNHLAKVVEDLLNVTKIEQGGMKYEMASFDFGKAVSDLAQDLSVTAQKKGLELTYSDDGSKPYTVNGDMEKIRQVILNLIDNSIKYTAKGWIKVEVKRNTSSTVLFSVSDSGMGATPEIIATLFQKFSRGEGGKVNTGGSGLGLYLAKQIVEAHKGRVWVESPGKDKGATFFVELNLQ